MQYRLDDEVEQLACQEHVHGKDQFTVVHQSLNKQPGKTANRSIDMPLQVAKRMSIADRIAPFTFAPIYGFFSTILTQFLAGIFWRIA